MSLSKLWVIKKESLFIGIGIIFFTLSLITAGITQHDNFSQLEKLIVIDPGHGSIDTGTHKNGVFEKDINLAIAKQLADHLEKGEIKVVLTREDDSLYQNDRNKDIKYRARFANQQEADLFISIHVNSFPGTSTLGGQVFYTPNSAPSKQLAQFIQQKLIDIQPNNRRQIKSGDFYVLNQTTMPAVLVETGFLSNQQDFQRLTNPQIRKEIAAAISEGIINYLNNNLSLPPTKQIPNKTAAAPLSSNNQFRVYFPQVNSNSTKLIPLTKEVPVTKMLTPNSKSIVENLAASAVQSLIKGPSSNQQNLISLFPSTTKLLNLDIENKTAYVNFNQQLVSDFQGGSTAEKLLIDSIIKTLTQFSEINQVQILIAGEKNCSISGHLLLNQPQSKKDLLH
ncbi:MAG: N-acetylmuramoyl-L-alanine amidase [Bacillota bacterium]